MLEATFQHIQGVGETTERTLWSMGCTSWDKLLQDDYSIPQATYRRLKAGVLESRGRLKGLDHRYFRACLRGAITWRAYRAFRDHACYLDIETTGLSPSYDEVTAVCVHSNNETETFIQGKNLDSLKKYLNNFKYLVSFNGARFDLPFLTESLGIAFNHIHLDLMYPLRSLGFRGGLKFIEKDLGLARQTEGVDGLDAVRLWRAYKLNREVEVAGKRVKGEDALDLLVEYNREDTVNLERLAEMTVERLIQRHMGENDL